MFSVDVPEGRGPSSEVGESLDDPSRSCVRPHAIFAEIGRSQGGLAMLPKLILHLLGDYPQATAPAGSQIERE